MRHVRSRTSIPIMADESVFDEHDAFRLVSMDACDYLNIKLAKSGGIHVGLKINAVAEAAGMRCMVGCMTESRLGLSAGAHLVSARPNIAFADLDGADMLRDDPVVGGMVYEHGGRIALPEEPGLGADIDPAYLESLESFTVT
jgi:L-alanine-DL-glutamate epimerase-like enolase superfamily enzyme